MKGGWMAALVVVLPAMLMGAGPSGAGRRARPLPAAARGPAPAATPYQYIRTGQAENVRVHPRAGYALVGGGTDLDEAFQWLCERSAGGDLLVLRASGTAAYNPYIAKLCPRENSVATLILPSRAAANDPFAARAIAAASAIFISGGDQSNYINYWTGTPVQAALQRAMSQGIPMGGTSAGLAVLGEFAYSAQHDTAQGPDLTSAVALANPYQNQVVVVRRFLHSPTLAGVITDTHFHNRDRLGRLLVFMARILQDGQAPRVHGIGVDQHTALLVDGNGAAVAAGTGAVYLLAAAGKPAGCVAGAPLDFGPVRVRRLAAGDPFNLHSWTGAGVTYTLTVKHGIVDSSQPGGSIY